MQAAVKSFAPKRLLRERDSAKNLPLTPETVARFSRVPGRRPEQKRSRQTTEAKKRREKKGDCK